MEWLFTPNLEKKIGWNLLKEAERSSKQNGISRMYLSTTPFLMEAIHLYENFRFLKTSHPPFELYHTPLFYNGKKCDLIISE
jgi:N-acetylglutamate synthase-like GNAT family acetyltransferase